MITKGLSIRKIHKNQYPYQLRQLNRLPESMDISGSLPGSEYKYLCVVGSRRHSDYGAMVCRRLIGSLQGHPVVIVSGLAYGIDSIAHQSAIDAGLPTVSFPGSGLSSNVLYPKAHLNLAIEIVRRGGAVLSPFELEQCGADWTFPVRNRLMAGISHAVLIIEAGKGSGTLLTAGYAGEFGRDVLAVPGMLDSPLSYGPHMLMRNGAVLIGSPDDLLQELGFDVRKNESRIDMRTVSFTDNERSVLACLQLSAKSAGHILEETNLSIRQLNILLSGLELRGIIVEKSGLYRLRS